MTLPLTDDVREAFPFNDNLTGDLLVEYPRTGSDESHADCVYCEIYGLHIGGNVVLTRNTLVQIESETFVRHIEQVLLEERTDG